MRLFPALDVTWPEPPDQDAEDRLLADVDAFDPTAVEHIERGVRVFFLSETTRDEARASLASVRPELTTTALLVPDESWAERSQAAVSPVRIGRIIVSPPWAIDAAHTQAAAIASLSPIIVTILPSMGFGTGHHASTRLCLTLLQRLAIAGRTVLDVGTGSGVLAIAAARLGASRATGIDYDPDALSSAADNVELNAIAEIVSLRVADLANELAGGAHDIVLGNLTGAVLMRFAPRLVAELRPGGSLIVSGFQTHERQDVIGTFAAAGAMLADEAGEDDWIAARLEMPSVSSSPRPSTSR